MKLIDLSVPLDDSPVEPEHARIKYLNHRQGANLLGLAGVVSPKSMLYTLKNLLLYLLGINKITYKNFPEKAGLAWEEIRGDTHAGTHLDAPWHFGPLSEGKPSKTIDEVPLEWCYGDGVVLDLRHKKAGEFITTEDLKTALKKINYVIKSRDIILIMTGADKHWGEKNYFFIHPGLSGDAVLWMLNQGVRVLGTDGYGMDRPFRDMIRDYKKTKDKDQLWPAHFAGRIKEYCHMEKMANLNKIPKPYGFKIVCFPVKIKKASAGWVRPVAIIEN